MEAARAAVAKHTSRRGHTTEVHETVLPAVTRETIKPSRHEIHTEAVDREIHQHHYHTTVQPLSHTETLPAVHTHNLIPIKHTEHHHGDHEASKARVAAELAAFKNHTVTMPVVHTKAVNAPVIGEHFHHHVHETVQPIIHKETHRPEIVHTTIPIHEVHHHEPIHHGISQLTAKPMAEFTKLGGLLTGSKQATRETYDGAPRSYLPELSTTLEKLGFGAHGHHEHGEHHAHTTPEVAASAAPVAAHAAPTTTTTGPITTTTTTTHASNGVAHTTMTGPETVTTGPITTTTASSVPRSKPAPISTSLNRRSMGDNVSPISASSSSSPEMPSTPTNHKFNNDNVAINRQSDGFSVPSSPQYNAAEVNNTKTSGTGFISRIRSHGRRSLDQRQ